VTGSVACMHRRIWRLVSGRSVACAAPGSFVLVHRSGLQLAGGDGRPLVFPSAASADEFRMRFTCEPPAYRCTEASDRRVAA
jgi:hypothetical protein